jgi:two-component system nitrogen regulation response regulator GlnG
MVTEGTFRADLYYRLNVYTIRLPAMRDRGDDLPLLVEHFVRRYARELGKEARGVSPEAMEILRRYPWPGNVRELQSVVKQTLLQTTGPLVLPDFLPASVRRGQNGTGESGFDYGGLTAYVEEQLAAGSTRLYADYQALTDRHLFTLVLRHTGGNLSRAALTLGITRATLRSKLAALGIPVERPTGGPN